MFERRYSSSCRAGILSLSLPEVVAGSEDRRRGCRGHSFYDDDDDGAVVWFARHFKDKDKDENVLA